MNNVVDRAYIGLGSNIGDRRKNIADAIIILGDADGVTVNAVSPVYETKPVGFADQPDFLNCVAVLDTNLTPYALLDICQSIENRLGRLRTIKWGPRTVDLDILFFGGLVMDDERLRIPHLDAWHRGFVLAPLFDIAPDLLHPGLNKTIRELYRDYLNGRETRRDIKKLTP